jgi:hypothetical protein
VHDVAHGGQSSPDLGHLLAAVDVLVAVAVPGHGQEHGRLDLPEAVDDATGAELRSAAGPHRAEAGRGQKRYERLRDVGEIRHDPVAAADTEPAQSRTSSSHLVAQLIPGQLLPVTRLRVGEHGDPVGALGQTDRVLGVVERRTREPLGTGHLPPAEQALRCVANRTAKNSAAADQNPS